MLFADGKGFQYSPLITHFPQLDIGNKDFQLLWLKVSLNSFKLKFLSCTLNSCNIQQLFRQLSSYILRISIHLNVLYCEFTLLDSHYLFTVICCRIYFYSFHSFIIETSTTRNFSNMKKRKNTTSQNLKNDLQGKRNRVIRHNVQHKI